jgi:hypothetical protein
LTRGCLTTYRHVPEQPAESQREGEIRHDGRQRCQKHERDEGVADHHIHEFPETNEERVAWRMRVVNDRVELENRLGE